MGGLYVKMGIFVFIGESNLLYVELGYEYRKCLEFSGFFLDLGILI